MPQGHIKESHVLAVQGIAPLLMLIALVDQLLLNGVVLGAMPSSPAGIPGYTLIFGLPHIVASLISFADREYIHYYRYDLTKILSGALLLSIVVVFVVPVQMGYVIVLILTMVHVIAQQTGIARAYLRAANNIDYSLWKWASITTTAAVACALGGEAGVSITTHQPALFVLAGVSFGVGCGFAYRLANYVDFDSSVRCVAAVQMTLFVALVCVGVGYGLFAVFAIRIIHDITAFMVYISHDRSRRSQGNGNLLYAAVMLPSKHILWFLPLSSVMISSALIMFVDAWWILWITLIHYGMERIMWARGSMHRNSIRFSASGC